MNSSQTYSRPMPPTSSKCSPVPWWVGFVVAGACLIVAVVMVVLFLKKTPSSPPSGGSKQCNADTCPDGECNAGICTYKCTHDNCPTLCKGNKCQAATPCPLPIKCTAGDDNVTCTDNVCNVSKTWKGQCPSGCTWSGQCPTNCTGACPSGCNLDLCPRCYSGNKDTYDPRNLGNGCFAPKLTQEMDNFETPCICDMTKKITPVGCAPGWGKLSTSGNNYMCTQS